MQAGPDYQQAVRDRILAQLQPKDDPRATKPGGTQAAPAPSPDFKQQPRPMPVRTF